MKTITKNTLFPMSPSLPLVLFITTLFACNPLSAATPTEPSVDQIASLVAPLTPEPTAMPAGEIYAWNHLAEIKSAGVSIQVARLVIADKLALPKDVPTDPVFQEMPVVAQIIFIVKNTGDEMLMVFPAHATVDTGAESFFLQEFPFFIGDIVSGGVQPGETKLGGYWFGFRQTPMGEIQHLSVSFSAPIKFGDPLSEPQGPGYNFDLDLSQRRNDPVPDELKNLKSVQ